MTETARIAHDEDGIRVDRWFKRHYPHLNHILLEKLLRKGEVRLDGKRLKLFLSEYTLPTGHPNLEFNFHVTEATQAMAEPDNPAPPRLRPTGQYPRAREMRISFSW